MAKRRGPSASRPQTRSEAAKERREASTSERGVEDDDKFSQLTSEFLQHDGKRAKLSAKQHELEQKVKDKESYVRYQKLEVEKQEHELEVQKHKLEVLRRELEDLVEQRQPLRREMEQLEQNWLPKGHRLKDVCKAREAENATHLDKLPHEVWAKILNNLNENDLFPLALSCRCFRQKQKELVERAEYLAFQTSFGARVPDHDYYDVDPVSADYLRFCSKEKVSLEVRDKRNLYTRCLAAFHGHLPLLQELLLEEFKPSNTSDDTAIRDDLLSEFTKFAARGGQLETLEWLKTQKGFELDTAVFGCACEGGHFETLKWLRREGCPWDVYACSGAASGGHLEVLKWLRSEGCPWDARACHAAAWGGHLEVLKWLRSEGCLWNEWTCRGAAEGGHLDVLRWAIDNGCPYEVNYATRAALRKLGYI